MRLDVLTRRAAAITQPRLSQRASSPGGSYNDSTSSMVRGELHHRGDLGDASYAAVPHLVRIAGAFSARDWNFHGLVSTIEVERHRLANPQLPDWLGVDSGAAWSRVRDLALADLRRAKDPLTVRAILGAAALAKRQRKLGAWIAFADESESDEALEAPSAWSEAHRSLE